MKKTHCHTRRNTAGFTLIEVLLAMVITLMVLATCGMLYYSIAQAWISHKQGDATLQHNHSMVGFLNQQLSINPLLPTNSPVGVDPEVRWSSLPEASAYDPVYLSWGVAQPPVFLKTGDWLDHVAARLYLKYDSRAGLSIIWHPEDSKIDRMDFTNYDVLDYVFEFPLSLNIVSLSYAYWDSEKENWEIEPHLRNYKPKDELIPDALIITVQEQELVTHTIYIGKAAHG